MTSAISIVLILGTVVVIAFHTLRLIDRKRWNVFDPLNFFWGGVLAVYVIQPLTYGDIYDSWHLPGVFERTCFWVLFGMVFVALGYESRLGPALTRKVPETPVRLDAFRMQMIAYAIIGLGLLGYAYQVASAGGFENWLAIGRGGTDWRNVSIYLAQTADLLPVGIMILLFDVELHTRSVGKRLFAWSLGSGMLIWLFYLGTRSRVVVFGLVLLAAYYAPRRRNPPWALLASCGLILFVTVEFLGQYREQFTNLSLNVSQEDLPAIGERVLPGWLGGAEDANRLGARRGAEFDCVMAVIELVPDAVPYNYGYALLELLTRPIPRALWPAKRYPHYESFTPIQLAAGMGGARIETEYATLVAGPAFTFVGHWYATGGPFMLGLMGFLSGVFFRGIRGIHDRGFGEADSILYIVLAPVAFSEAAATPLFFLFNLPYQLIPVILLFVICRVPGGHYNADVQPGIDRSASPGNGGSAQSSV